MSTLGASALTLVDVAKRTDKDGKISKIVEILNQTNEVLDDMGWVEGNLPTGHKSTIRTGLPTSTWRLLNYGVSQTKSQTVQVTDTCGMLENYSTVDKSLADLNGNTNDFRFSEDRAFLESMNQQVAQTLFYGNTATNPERFLGLAPRYNSLSANNQGNIIRGGGTASVNTSVWLVCWGDLTVHGIYPKGSKAGFSLQDLGEQTVYDGSNNPYQAYRTHYKWDCGLTVRDWRYVVRIANIDTAQLTKGAATGGDLVDLMTQAIEALPNTMMGTPVFYCNKLVRSYLRRQIANKIATSTLAMEDVGGKKVVMYDNIPVRRSDQLLNTEATVS